MYVRLNTLFMHENKFTEAPSPVYGEKDVTIKYQVAQLLWRPLGELVHFILVIHPTRGKIIIMSTDLYLKPLDAIKLYGYRFKIEHSFKQTLYVLGTFAYHAHIQLGLIAHGLMQYLSATFSKDVWASFGSWLRTV